MSFLGRELFEQEGIHFAHRKVTVHVADGDGRLREKEKQAVSGAVRPLLDEQDREQTKPQDAMLDLVQLLDTNRGLVLTPIKSVLTDHQIRL